jgi:hypothetical protein
VIFSAVPGGTVPGCHLYPGLASWATLSRPFGTQFVSRALTQTLKPNLLQFVYGPTKLKSCPDTKPKLSVAKPYQSFQIVDTPECSKTMLNAALTAIPNRRTGHS